MQQKLKNICLSGQRLGKHKVPEGEASVQIGEDLSESLRELKVRLCCFVWSAVILITL